MAAKTINEGFKILDRIEKNKPESLTKISQELQCLVALGYLGGTHKLIHTEDIAVQLFNWLPKVYGWKLKKYSDYPDKQMPKRGLSYLRTYAWVMGGFAEIIEKDGWKLTSNGISVFNKLKHLTDANINSDLSLNDKKYLDKRIGKSNLFKQYLHSMDNSLSFEVNQFALADFLQVNPGMDSQARTSFFNLLTMSKSNNLTSYINFLEQLMSINSELLNEQLFVFESRQKKPKGA